MGNDRAVLTLNKALTLASVVFKKLTQVREHITAVVVIPQAGSIEGLELGSRKSSSRDRQSDRLVESLKTGQTYSSLPGLIGMLITISTTTFDTGSERRVVAALRDQVTNNHFTLFCHEYRSPH